MTCNGAGQPVASSLSGGNVSFRQPMAIVVIVTFVGGFLVSKANLLRKAAGHLIAEGPYHTLFY